MSRKPWGHLRRVLPVNTHPDRQWRILDTFDWYSPRYQDKDCSPARVLGWCRESHVRDVQVLAFPTSIRGRRDAAGVLPEVRWSIPDVRSNRVLVFGAGAAGQQFSAFIRRIAPSSLVGIVDNDPAKHGMRIGSLAVQRFDEVPRHAYDVVVIASLPGRHAITGQLQSAGLRANEQILGADQVQQWYDLVLDCETRAA
jgi:hypothetical protein